MENVFLKNLSPEQREKLEEQARIAHLANRGIGQENVQHNIMPYFGQLAEKQKSDA